MKKYKTLTGSVLYWRPLDKKNQNGEGYTEMISEKYFVRKVYDLTGLRLDPMAEIFSAVLRLRILL
jgi:hypothetical protein